MNTDLAAQLSPAVWSELIPAGVDGAALVPEVAADLAGPCAPITTSHRANPDSCACGWQRLPGGVYFGEHRKQRAQLTIAERVTLVGDAWVRVLARHGHEVLNPHRTKPAPDPGPARPKPRPGERWMVVSLDDEGTTYKAIVGEQRWNGWACPSFPADQVERMRADFDRIARAWPGSVDTLRWAKDRPDVVEVVSCQYNTDLGDLLPRQRPHVERIAANGRGLYPVGAYSWCWYEVEPLSVEDRVAECLTVTLVLSTPGRQWTPEEAADADVAALVRSGEIVFATADAGLTNEALWAGADPTSWPEHDGLQAYTVVGLTDTDGRLTVAGVIEGDHPLVDASVGDDGEFRWATVVRAHGPDDAEARAAEECLAANGDDDETEGADVADGGLHEVTCGTCGETFTPTIPDDLEHAERESGEPCGGRGEYRGTWTNR